VRIQRPRTGRAQGWTIMSMSCPGCVHARKMRQTQPRGTFAKQTLDEGSQRRHSKDHDLHVNDLPFECGHIYVFANRDRRPCDPDRPLVTNSETYTSKSVLQQSPSKLLCLTTWWGRVRRNPRTKRTGSLPSSLPSPFPPSLCHTSALVSRRACRIATSHTVRVRRGQGRTRG